MGDRRGSSSALPWCLIFSGGAALMYEVLWLRQVSLVMGHTAYALAALLTAFLGGLAVGAYLGGVVAERFRITARGYALIEVLVAITALLVPLVITALAPVFGALHRAFADALLLHSLAQFAVCVGVLFMPTVLMGMTLPIVVEVVTPADHTATVDVGRLYALNSLGGVLGAGAAGVLLLPVLGELRTSFVAAALNVLAAAFAILGSFDDAEPSERPDAAPAVEPVASWPAPTRRVLIGLYAAAGFTAIALQVGWARLVALSVGSTIYGFAITLVTFIAGLALGSGVLVRWRAIRRDPVRSLFVLHAIVGVWTIASLPWLGGLPNRIADTMAHDVGFWSLWLLQLALVFATIVIPTLAMGAIFPLVAELLRRDHPSSGRAVGTAFAANTVGNIGGSMVAGFVLIPWVGMSTAILISAGLSAALALVYLYTARAAFDRVRGTTIGVGLVVLTVAGIVLVPRWDPGTLADAPFLRHYQKTPVRELLGPVIDHVEGPTTVAAVRQSPHGLRSLYIGGVHEAASSSPVHGYLAHQALLLHPAPRRVLLVGLGTGNTLAAILEHPVEQVDVLELSPEVVEMAKKHFLGDTRHALADPRVELIVGDGRSHLLYAGRTYDVIISQPSYPWAGGAARLFTKEYFEAIRSSLEPDGLTTVWFPVRYPDGKFSLLATFDTVFPSAAIFFPQENFQFYFVVGFRADDDAVDLDQVRRAFQRPGIGVAARRVGIKSPEALLARRIPWPAAGTAARRTVPLNTDDNGYVEFGAFRRLLVDR